MQHVCKTGMDVKSAAVHVRAKPNFGCYECLRSALRLEKESKVLPIGFLKTLGGV